MSKHFISIFQVQTLVFPYSKEELSLLKYPQAWRVLWLAMPSSIIYMPWAEYAMRLSSCHPGWGGLRCLFSSQPETCKEQRGRPTRKSSGEKKQNKKKRTSFSNICGIKNRCGDPAGVPLPLNSQLGFLFSRVLFQAKITWEIKAGCTE